MATSISRLRVREKVDLVPRRHRMVERKSENESLYRIKLITVLYGLDNFSDGIVAIHLYT